MNTEQTQDYAEWEGEIFDAVEELCQVTRSDAQAIVQAQPFYVAQSWVKGLSSEEAARVISEQGTGLQIDPVPFSGKWERLTDLKKLPGEIKNLWSDELREGGVVAVLVCSQTSLSILEQEKRIFCTISHDDFKQGTFAQCVEFLQKNFEA